MIEIEQKLIVLWEVYCHWGLLQGGLRGLQETGKIKICCHL